MPQGKKDKMPTFQFGMCWRMSKPLTVVGERSHACELYLRDNEGKKDTLSRSAGAVPLYYSELRCCFSLSATDKMKNKPLINWALLVSIRPPSETSLYAFYNDNSITLYCILLSIVLYLGLSYSQKQTILKRFIIVVFLKNSSKEFARLELILFSVLKIWALICRPKPNKKKQETKMNPKNIC